MKNILCKHFIFVAVKDSEASSKKKTFVNFVFSYAWNIKTAPEKVQVTIVLLKDTKECMENSFIY